jgi:hypothetical protein
VTYRSDVKYIEDMQPHLVEAAAEDFKRVVRMIDSALPALDRARGKVEWSGDGGDLLDRRLKEANLLLEALRDGYDKAGGALDDYATTQAEAKILVSEGVQIEAELGNLIRHIEDPGAEPMKKWDDLRGTQGMFDWIGELGKGDEIDRVRAEADRLSGQASDYYDRAKRTESEGRGLAVRALDSARANLPDFLADSRSARAIIDGTPGLRRETYQAAKDPNARRPGDVILNQHQVADDPDTKMFPGWPLSWLVDQREVRSSEADLLRELQHDRGLLGLKKFQEIHDEAFRVADERFSSLDRNDDHNDAFRHAYWNARLTQEFGEDWTRRFATAHESVPGNQAAREAMDLYNNEVGRSIAVANPDASPEELADKVQQAVRQGRTVVIGGDGELDYSDQIRPEETGDPARRTLPGHPQPGKPTGS